jgi:hypothetical protein
LEKLSETTVYISRVYSEDILDMQMVSSQELMMRLNTIMPALHQILKLKI